MAGHPFLQQIFLEHVSVLALSPVLGVQWGRRPGPRLRGLSPQVDPREQVVGGREVCEAVPGAAWGVRRPHQSSISSSRTEAGGEFGPESQTGVLSPESIPDSHSSQQDPAGAPD